MKLLNTEVSVDMEKFKPMAKITIDNVDMEFIQDTIAQNEKDVAAHIIGLGFLELFCSQ